MESIINSAPIPVMSHNQLQQVAIQKKVEWMDIFETYRCSTPKKYKGAVVMQLYKSHVFYGCLVTCVLINNSILQN